MLPKVLKNIQYEKMNFTHEGVKQDFDRYNVEMRSPLATHEYSVTVDHIKKELGGDVIRYGSWDDLEMDEIIEILELVEKEGKLERPFREYVPVHFGGSSIHECKDCGSRLIEDNKCLTCDSVNIGAII